MLPAETVFRDIAAVLPGSGVRVATDDDIWVKTNEPATARKESSYWTQSSATSSVGESSLVTKVSNHRHRWSEISSQPTIETGLSIHKSLPILSRNNSSNFKSLWTKFSDSYSERRAPILALQTYLGGTDRPIDELNGARGNQTEGSCSWIEVHDGFQ
jgi:hypothetical protein